MRRNIVVGIAVAVTIATIQQPTKGAHAADCNVLERKIFETKGKHRQPNETVVKARPENNDTAGVIAVFKAPLAVNTDGAPVSYHPDDYTGSSLAINHIENGITIRRTSGKATTPAERRRVFDRWVRNDWRVPRGYSISWQNVIAAVQDRRGRNIPCRFSADSNDPNYSKGYSGYFGSLTRLKNNLPANHRGPCEADNQIDERYIPGIVLRGGKRNPLTGYGAGVGDLVVAIRPRSEGGAIVVPAVIADTGDANRIGEGSVALNMRLLDKSDQPTTYREALRLDTGTSDIVIAVLPGSAAFEPEHPYSTDNIAARVAAWAKAKGYGDLSELAATATACARGL